jgi:hypothetical protein
VKDDNQENRLQKRYFRYAVFSLAALLVLSLGFAFIPPEPPAPAEPPFSERARAAAFEETMRLRSAGLELAATGGNAAAGATAMPPVDGVVTLLTLQARALLLPAGPPPTDPASARAAAASAIAPPAGASPSASPPSPAPPAQVTPAGFAAALAASGQQRLKDAETADGGMARLLAGTGTAQLLAAERLGAQGAGTAPATAPAGASGAPGPTKSAEASACPAAPTAPEEQADADTSLGAALAAVAVAERETVYGYQAALTRLPSEGARPASDFLKQHQDLAVQAETLSLRHCRGPVPQQPGYVLDQAFLDAPAAGLARLESDILPAYGDIVALADGSTRAWALSALQGAARRAQHWGAGAVPLPGLVVDAAQLPQLPA